MTETGIILLAAGASTRLGRLKQLVPWQGTTLLRHAALKALATPFRPIVVVLGCQADRTAAELADLSVQTRFYPHWVHGMGGSLAAGMAALLTAAPALQGVILALPDQPLVTTADLIALGGVATTNPRIVAASYRQILGVPAYFPSRFFPELLALQGELGARVLLQRHAAQVEAFPLPTAAFDLDTPADYQRLRALTESQLG